MTADYRPPTVSDLMTRFSGSLKPLIAKSAALKGLNRALAEYLETPLNLHCRIADLSSGTVIFHADSPVWSSRLRYRIPPILDFLRRDCQLPGLVSAKIRVRHPDQSGSVASSRHLELSPAASAVLQNVAQATPDRNLRQAWLRLSRHAK